MNSIIKGALIFLGGAAIGGGTAYIFTKNILEEQNEKVISDRVQDALTKYKSYELSKLNNEIKEEIKDKILNDDIKDKFDPIKEQWKENIKRYVPVDIPVEEPKEAPDDEEPVFERHNAFDEPIDIPEDEVSEEEEVTKGENKTPYLISPKEYQYDYVDEYEKESLIFFKDNVLTDQDFAEISAKDAEKLLGGAKLFTAFGSKGAKKNVVYIRNELLHIDYEIVHSPRKYTQEVLHMEDEEDNKE